jgi:Bardet-Biedl syndrome 5 protein
MRMRDSKFGRAIVLETFSKAGGYILGFRVDPKERINDVFKELLSLYQVYSTTPIFGVEFSVESSDDPTQASSKTHLEMLSNNTRVTEDVELLDDQEDSQAIAAYYSQNGMLNGDGNQDEDNIQYDSKLGLAVETLINGLTLEQLWRVV